MAASTTGFAAGGRALVLHLRFHWRGRQTDLRAAADAVEQVQVAHVQHAQHQQQGAELRGQRLDSFGAGPDHVTGLERQQRVAEVQQVEADDEQPVDRARHARVVGEHLLEKHLAVLEQRAREPDGEPDAGAGVDEIDR